MTIMLVASALPALLLSLPLIEKIYQITKDDALSELRLRAQHLSLSLSHQIELTATRLVTLGETSDVVIAAYSSLFRGLAARYMFQFKDDNPVVLSVYLIDDSLLPAEAVPAAAEATALPEPVRKAVADMLGQPAETVQSKYVFVSFRDRQFIERSFQLVAPQKNGSPILRAFPSDYGLALIVPLVEKIGEGSGRKVIKGALAAVLPAEYLINYLASMVRPPESFSFMEEDSGHSLLRRQQNAPRQGGELRISSGAPLLLSSTAEGAVAIAFRITLSEPESVRFSEANRTLRKVAVAFLAALFPLLLLSCFAARMLAAPLEKMKRIVNQYSLGNYHHTEEALHFIEFKSFADLLTNMGSKIMEQFNELKQINHAYARFVPNDLLSHLEKKSIIDVQLGDHVRRHMSVMFADIRNFTEISERMSPEDNFRFVNSVLNRIGPIIREHGGFIDKYIGDSIMALFHERPDDAVKAGVAMLRALETHNEEIKKYGFEPVRMGIGINTGDLMLGTIGEHGRMEGTVISDAVNLASRLEGLTKLYGAAMLISDQTFYNLVDPSQFHVRVLDLVAVKGKKHPVTVLEVVDGEHKDVQSRKLKTKEQFELGVSLYREKEFLQAVTMMRQVLSQHPGDKAAVMYIERCESSIWRGTGCCWDGVTRLREK
ncbi:adenylate/guanylate cyclase domain-containing protein [Candidatus Electronema sp. TJ]|uniref:adenylate/guanylate cyclase domain-containing protein n=1 Tax=Candidatus Electronema sp. TJ TaxID=3401573 RepID=UPI003AA9C64B